MLGKGFNRDRSARNKGHRLSYKQIVCISLSAVAVIFLCCFGAYTYANFEKECRNVALREAVNASRLVTAQVDERLNNLSLYYISKVTADDVQWVVENDMNYSDYPHIKDAQDAFSCKNYVDDYVDGYTFVNYRTNWVISSKGMYHLNEAVNSEILDAYFVDSEGYRNKYYWFYDESEKLIDRVNRQYRTTIETAGLNYVMRLPYGFNPYALLIVNVNEGTWQKWIKQQLAVGEEVVALDRNGNLLYASVQELADKILEMGGAPTTGEFSASGRKYMAAASVSGILDWQYYVFHDIALERNDFQFSVLWMAIILIAALVVFVLAAYMIYQPVGNLVKDISTGSDLPDKKTVVNELDFLSGSIHTLQRDNHSLQTAMEKSKDKLLELFELRLVRGEVKREDEWREYVEDFKLRSWKYFATVVVVLDLSEAEETQSCVSEDVICLRLVEEMPEKIKSMAWMPPIYNACTIFAILAEDNEYLLFERIENYYLALQNYAQQVSGYSLLMGVSTNHTDHRHIQAAYRESVMALTFPANNLDDRRDNAAQMENCRFYLSSSTVASGSGYSDNYEKEIQTAIKSMDKVQCYKVIDDFCYFLAGTGVAQHEVMVYVLRFVNSILVTAMEAKVDLAALYPQGLRKLYSEILEVLEPSRERRYIKTNLIDPVLAARDNLLNQKSYSILQDIENLIREKKGNITLTECAEALDVHPTYIWKVLKMEKGKSFSDYTEEYKLEEAKRLLINTSMTVAEIATELNYTNAQNFIRFFSKGTGVTPGKFRKLY